MVTSCDPCSRYLAQARMLYVSDMLAFDAREHRPETESEPLIRSSTMTATCACLRREQLSIARNTFKRQRRHLSAAAGPSDTR